MIYSSRHKEKNIILEYLYLLKVKERALCFALTNHVAISHVIGILPITLRLRYPRIQFSKSYNTQKNHPKWKLLK